ncbi:hypothetical protein DQ04_00201170 [Trypanosoma grayi]|uniref:hypothetical protein n=1 Tax=Trypanosoma grayi TaxID=71804 RepID=UPI0004F40DD0|nr:hypothetical protein DQ04_00201170 [Trypanosoma grayi]KEG15064.1 hypothetical protein DQ04_00201170 [Trypanosoma grayi]
MLRGTPVRRIGTVSTVLANIVLVAANGAGVQNTFGVLFLGGVMFRALLLPLTIFGDRCLARAACALPELQEAHKEYKEIVNHPRAILWEKKVAAQKLKNDRERIFRSYNTDNARLVLPHAAALFGSLYSLCIPAQQLGDFLGASDVAAPLAFHVSGAAMDPTLALAATLTFFNTQQHLQRRMGFSDGLDAWIRQVKTNMTVAWGVFVVASLLSQILAGAALGVSLPPYVAPVWLGIGAMSCCKSVLVNHTAPMRALCGIPDYPLTHGTCGALSTAEAHEYRLAFTGVDVEERRDMWQTQKKALDYECNVRLHRMLKQIGLFDRIEEAQYEAEKLKRKLDVARSRRQQREQQKQQSGDDGVAVSSQLREADVVGPSAESVAESHFDEIQVQENERRLQRRSVEGS